MEKNILQVFRTYCDAYLEYLNNFVNWDSFCEFYELSEQDSGRLLQAMQIVKEQGGRYSEIDYYYNVVTNCEYSEKTAIF